MSNCINSHKRPTLGQEARPNLTTFFVKLEDCDQRTFLQTPSYIGFSILGGRGKADSHSPVPRPPHSFCRLQYEKRGGPGIFYHVNDVGGRQTLERP